MKQNKSRTYNRVDFKYISKRILSTLEKGKRINKKILNTFEKKKLKKKVINKRN